MAMDQGLSIKIPKGLLKEIDLLIKEEKYSGRSDFVKAAIRALLIHLKNLEIYSEQKNEHKFEKEDIEQNQGRKAGNRS